MSDSKNLRLHFPQWQGGDNEAYYFGSQLLSYIAPPTNGLVETVDVPKPDGSAQVEEGGLKGRSQIIKQAKQAQQLIDKHQPDSIVVLGGDCLVDLAPFAYLNKKYDGQLGVLWVDAHPDILTPEQYNHAHAMVMGNLMGFGDEQFTALVERPIATENVLYAGLGKTLDFETDFIKEHQLDFIGPETLNQSSAQVIEWIKAKGIKKLAIHFDLDVMSTADFGSLYFAEPNVPADKFDGLTQGAMQFAAVQQLICDVASVTDVVGLGITEYLPWDAMRLQNMLKQFPLLNR
ncbi:arginase family protein [Celerinatantimonas sp. MCCC 1A17872]|uniref:arginase family protein n=1 Tax=Celerinatantimonas sp. MCCC 1A17872 TaxID=3177514 RepID=UPI0038C11406